MNKYNERFTYHAINIKNEELKNTNHNTNTITWGIYPNSQIIQYKKTDQTIFKQTWAKHAFNLWKTCFDFENNDVIKHIYNQYFLIYIVDNYYYIEQDDLFNTVLNQLCD